VARAGRIFATIDVNYLDDDRILAAADHWPLHFAALLAAKRGTSDGYLTKRQLRRAAPDSLADFDAALASCVRAGLFVQQGDGVVIRSWARWNTAQTDIEAMSKGGKRGNHVKWHVMRGDPRADCGFCVADGLVESGGESGGDRVPESDSIAYIDTDADGDVDEDSLSAAIAAVCHVDTALTKEERAEVAKAAKELIQVGATADEVHRRAPIITLRWQTGRLTPRALVRHWSSGASSIVLDDGQAEVDRAVLDASFSQWQSTFEHHRQTFGTWRKSQEDASTSRDRDPAARGRSLAEPRKDP
jgi:hypothetical protein